jgi:dihydrofolate synthase/folylpolyglutamate synthase
MQINEYYLNSLPKFHKDPGLCRINNFISKHSLNNLDGKYSIIIGGTNGKGSVTALLENVLLKAGIPVGSMKSPHIYHPGERLSFNGQNINENELMDILEYVKRFYRKSRDNPTLADVLTSSALIYFSKYVKPKVILLEVGIGGDLDPVNACCRNISVITNIGHDHSKILGEYPDEITRKKAGIVSKNTPLITGEENFSALEIMQEICSAKDSPFIKASGAQLLSIDFEGTRFLYDGLSFTIGIPGFNQIINGGIVLECIKLLQKTFKISSKAIEQGMRDTRLPWRMEIATHSKHVIFDGAHNKESWENLRKTLSFFSYKNLHIVLSIQKTKKPEDFPIEFLGKSPGSSVAVHIPEVFDKRFHRSEKIHSAISNFKGEIFIHSSLNEAYEKILKATEKDDLILFTGSFAKAFETREIIGME